MKPATLILSTLFASTHAGNVCVAGKYKPSRIDLPKLMAFAAGKPCDDGNSVTLEDTQVRTLCDHLPKGISICNKNANLVKIKTGPKADPGCQIGLEIDGKTYEGKTDKYNPDDGDHHGPCDASCGITTGIDGFLEFVGVPMC